MSAAPTKSQLLEVIETQKETIANQAKTIETQGAELTSAAEQITAICDGMKTIADNNALTRTMVHDVQDALNREQPISEGWWN